MMIPKSVVVEDIHNYTKHAQNHTNFQNRRTGDVLLEPDEESKTSFHSNIPSLRPGISIGSWISKSSTGR